VVQELSAAYPVRVLCRVLNISFSVFYAWKRGETYQPSALKSQRYQLVREVFQTHRRRYGARRISEELKARGMGIGRFQTRTLMKKQGLRAIQPKSFVPKTTQSHAFMRRSDHLLLDQAPLKSLTKSMWATLPIFRCCP
jgi:hypothetical protein